MKKLLISAGAAALVISFAVSADAAGDKNKQKASASVQASCKAQAAKKFTAVHFLKRRNFVNNCVAQHAGANQHAKAKSGTVDQKPTTTGQAPKQ